MLKFIDGDRRASRREFCMRYLLPKAVIKCDGEVKKVENLFIKKTLQIGLCEQCVTEINGKGYIILDFGKEISGGVRILNYSTEGANRVRIRFGESVGETCAEIGEKGATNDHSVRDMIVSLQRYSDMTFGQTGFRFVRIDFLSGKCSIKSVVAAEDEKREYIGSFESDDKLLNEIWHTAAETLNLCIKNGYLWDGIKRDRLVWIGDIYPETKAAYCLFGNIAEIKNSLIFCREQTPEGSWMNNIPAYSAWWLMNLCEYYFRSDDKEFVIENRAFAERILNDLCACVNEDGDVNFPFNFIDWATHYAADSDEPADESLLKKYEETAGTNYLLRMTIDKMRPLFKEFGFNAEIAEKAYKRLNKKAYDIKKHKQIAAFGVLAGEKNAQNEKVMLCGGAKGLTTFLNYFIFTALEEYGRHAEVFDMIKTYYGKMLELGATTFWEDFDVEWAENAAKIDEMPGGDKKDIHGDFGRFCYKGYRHSLCHGWSSGVVAYMSENILGINKIGCDEYSVKPNMYGLNKLKGSYPTPYGEIIVECEKMADGSLKTDVHAPDCIKIDK